MDSVLGNTGDNKKRQNWPCQYAKKFKKEKQVHLNRWVKDCFGEFLKLYGSYLTGGGGGVSLIPFCLKIMFPYIGSVYVNSNSEKIKPVGRGDFLCWSKLPLKEERKEKETGLNT